MPYSDFPSRRAAPIGPRWRSLTALVVLALVAPVSFSACGSDPAPSFDERACTSFVVPTRLGLRWENLNHRISRYAVQLSPAPGEACLAERVDTVFIGGDYSTGETLTDIPHLAWSGLRIVDADPTQLGAARLRLDAVIDARDGGEVSLERSYDRDTLKLLNYPHVLALVEGIALRTDVDQPDDYPDDYDPAHGYTSRGIGAEVEVLSLDADSLSLKATLRFAHGTSDRANMNRAMAYALTEAQVDVLLLGLQEAPLRGGSHSEVEVEVPPFMQDVEVPHGSSVPALFQGDRTVYQAALSGPYGWTGFRFELDPSETEDAGYYIRELSVALAPNSDSADSDGAIGFSLDGYVSNASKFIAYYGLNSRFEGAMAWAPGILSGEPGGGQVAPIDIDEAFDTGSASYEIAP